MNEVVIALIASACVAGAYRAEARTCPRHRIAFTLAKADEWSRRTTALADRVAGTALDVRERADEVRRPLPDPVRKRRD